MTDVHVLAQQLAVQGDVPIPLFGHPTAPSRASAGPDPARHQPCDRPGDTMTAVADRPATPALPQPGQITASDRRLSQAMTRVLSSHIAPTHLGFVLVSLRSAITAHQLTEAALARAAVSPTEALSDRELQVLRGMSEGMTNEEIARSVYLAIDTVKSHARRMFRKLGARDRAQAVNIAWQRGILGGTK